MKRNRWLAVSVTAGLFGASAIGDDVKPPQPLPKFTQEKPPAMAAPLPAAPAELVWRASSGAAPIATSAPSPTQSMPVAPSEIQWRPSGSSPETASIAPPSLVVESTSQGPHVERMVKPASGDVQISELPPPLVLPQDSTLSIPRRGFRHRGEGQPQEPPQPEKLPPPTPEALQKPYPKLLPEKAPPPAKVDPSKPSTFTPSIPMPAMSGDESTAIWGGYDNTQNPFPSAIPCDANTKKCGAYGSPSLKLSRDYQLLNSCKNPYSQEREQVLFTGDRDWPRRLSDRDWGHRLRDVEPAEENCFVSAELLLWWVNSGDIPVLASTGSSPSFGYLGAPSTVALLGAGPFGETFRPGFRLRAGAWCNDCRDRGFDAGVFVLGRVTNSTSFNSSQFPVLARPFFSPNFNAEFSELVGFPGLSSGVLTVEQTSFLWGLDANYRRSLCDDDCRRGEWFAGYRYLNLQERLTIGEFITAGASAPDPAGTVITVQDQFTVRNSFNGGQIGMAGGRRFERFDVSLRGSLALGNTHQTLEINGYQTVTPPGGAMQVFTGGLLAVGPNLGTFERDRFSVVPELTLNVGYYVRPHVKIMAGYNFLAWTNVMRPGEQIDRVVDLTFVPNAPAVPFAAFRPQPTFDQATLIVQGFQIGLEGTW